MIKFMLNKKIISTFIIIVCLLIILAIGFLNQNNQKAIINQINENQLKEISELTQGNVEDCLSIKNVRERNDCILLRISESEIPRKGCNLLQSDLREICEKMERNTLKNLFPTYQCWFNRESEEAASVCFDMGALRLDFRDNSNACDQFLFLKEECQSYVITQQALRDGSPEKCATIIASDQKQKCEKEVDRFADNDKDGLNNQDEEYYHTDPNNPDTDGDGYIDGEEVMSGYNPLGAGLLITP